MTGRPKKDPNAPDPPRIGIELLRRRLRERGVPMSHGAVHAAVTLHGMPAYLDTLHKNKNGEFILLFDFEEVWTWVNTRVVRYVPPAKPGDKIRDLRPVAKAR